VENLAGAVDFVLAFALVHELKDPAHFFAEIRATLAPGGVVLVAEPSGHVKPRALEASLAAARAAGLRHAPGPRIARSLTALLTPLPDPRAAVRGTTTSGW
jgi:hypothetical protein